MKLLSTCILSTLMCASLSAQQGRKADASFEWLASDDIDIRSEWALYESSFGSSSSLSGRIEYIRNQVDYLPNEEIDPFGFSSSLDESLLGAQIRWKRLVGKSEWGLTLSGYDGFRNYSSIWIDEYYRQQYSEGGIPGVSYEKPSPAGYGLDASWRYEAIPAFGFFTVSLGYLQDEVAPGYEIEDLDSSFELIRGKTLLDTWTGSIAWEGLLNARMRTSQLIRLTKTTDREMRYSWSGSVNWLLSDRWISRSSASYTRENPGFEAWSLSQTFEYTLTDHWILNATFRYYSDTGQIESANLVSSAAPSLSSRQAFLSLRYENNTATTSVSISTGPYETRYGKTGIGTERFKNLYSDRDWWWTRLALSHAF